MSEGPVGSNVVDDVLEAELRKVEEMISSFESQALERVRASKEAASRELEGLAREYASKAEGARSRILGMAEIRARGELLRLMDEKSEEVIREAMSRISSMPRDSEYEGILMALLEEAADAVGSQELIVRPARPDVQAVKKVISRASHRKRFRGISLRLSDDAVDSIGGLVVTSADGKVSYDNTFEARVARYREFIKSSIAEALRGKA